MPDDRRTKRQLIEELESLRAELAEMKRREAEGTGPVAQRVSVGYDLFRDLTQESSVGYYLVEGGLFRYVNPRLAEIFGYTVDELAGRLGPFDLTMPEDHARVEAYLRRRLSGEADAVRYRFRGRKKDGTAIEVEVSGSRTEFEGRPAVVGSLIDITEQERIAAEVTESRAWYRALAETAPVGIWHAEPDGTGGYINPKLSEISGLSVESARGDGWADGIHPDDRERVFREWTAYVRGEAPYHSTYRFLRPDGTVRWVIGNAMPARGPNGEILGHIGTLTDVTGLIERERALRRSQEQLRELATRERHAREEERTAVARELHDELGQLLTSLRLDLDAMEAGLAGGSESLAKKLEAAGTLAEQCIATLRDISARLRPPMLGVVGLSEAIEWLVLDFGARSQMEFATELGRGVPDLDDDAEIALYRIAQEALTNAVRHAGAGAVSVRLREESGTLVLTVRDDGVGIPPERTHDRRSFGILGMRERARAIGASFDVRPLDEGGTLVEVRVPVRAAERGPAGDLGGTDR